MKTDTDRTEAVGSVDGTRPGSGGPRKHEHNRRTAQCARIASGILVSLLLLVASIQFLARPACLVQYLQPVRSRSIGDRADYILSHTPLIDGHNDLAILVRALYNNRIYNETFSKPFAEGGLLGHVDIPRLRAGMSGGAFWSVFWPCPENGTDYSDANYHSIVQQTFQQIDLLARLRQAHPSVFSPPTLTSDTALPYFGRGQLISPLGIEGLHQIGNSAAVLRQFHALGVRYATLTHNCGNRFADAALWENPLRKAPPVWRGVSPEGRKMVREMNRLGMIVDLAHTSVDTMLDVLGAGRGAKDSSDSYWEGSRAPVIFSHSSAYGVCPHPRNVPDEVLDAVARNRGLVMVNFNPEFISCVPAPDREDGLPEFYPRNSTLQQVVRHILYIGERIGFEHVGLGSDYDGIQHTPEGLEDVSKFPHLVAELLRQGLSDETVSGIVGGNMLRVWKEADAVAEEMQKAGEPVLEDELPSLFSAD